MPDEQLPQGWVRAVCLEPAHVCAEHEHLVELARPSGFVVLDLDDGWPAVVHLPAGTV